MIDPGTWNRWHRCARRWLPLAAWLFASSGAVAQAPHHGSLILAGAKVYVSPTEPPLGVANVVMRDGRIVDVVASLPSPLPSGATLIDCAGKVVVAGFQNSHVHFTESALADAKTRPAAALQGHLESMLLQHGFTTAVDISSELRNTVALRTRIERGEVAGPRILTSGGGLFPYQGIPFYLKSLPKEVQSRLKQPRTAHEARELVQQNVAGGADLVKLFTGTMLTPTQVKPMAMESAAAAVTEAHASHRLVFAHPSNQEGIRVALAAGVDVLAHTAPAGPAWDSALIARMKERDMALVPTLKLWSYEASKEPSSQTRNSRATAKALQQLGAYARAGGPVMFGTDVGYMTDYDPSDEYVLMKHAGLSPMQILASLTSTPARIFREHERRGRVAAEQDADLVVLQADPAADVRNFAKVSHTIRAGRVLYAADTRGKKPPERQAVDGATAADR
jgi:imidazolonepropionase-like amidohydrolase